MSSSTRFGISIGVVVALAGAGASAPAEAQVWKKVKSSVAERVEARKQRADSAIVRAATGAVDTTLAQGNRVVDAGAGKVETATNAAIDRTERGVVNAFTAGGNRSTADRLAADLASVGRVVALRGIDFVAGAAALQPSSEPTLAAIAKALKSDAAVHLIEGHTDASGDVAAEQSLSELRAAAVKARLVAMGVPAAKLFAMGYGATRPLAAGPATATATGGGADGAKSPSGKAAMAKSVAVAVVPGAHLLGMGAKALKARQAHADSTKGIIAPAENARIEIVRMQ